MHYLGELSALTAALLWSFSSFVFTSATKRISTFLLNLSRLLFAWILLIITIVIFKVDLYLSINQLLFLSISGVIGLTLGDWFLFKSFKEIGPRISMLLMALNPAIAAILAFIFLNERITLMGILGIFVTLSGIALVISEKPKSELSKFKITKLGILMGILAAFGQGIGLIFSKVAYLSGNIHSFTATFVRIFSAFIFLLPVGLMRNKNENNISIIFKDKKTLRLVIIGSIIGPYLGITFSFLAVINTEVGVAATLMSTSPILILPLSIIFYKEKLTFRSIIGAFVAVIGISLLFLN